MKYADLIKVVLCAALLAGAAWFVYAAFGWREAADANAATIEQGDKTATATSTIATAAGAAQGEAAKVQVTITDARAAYAHSYEDLKREDPDVSAFADGRVPLRLRELARERYCARYGPPGSEARRAGDDRTPRDCWAGATPLSGD